ncbi:protein ORF61 [Pigeon adenovirus 1]|uniref:Protein ORF61 n=1 Tax=Pigeon adenovirus 1 TaxID=764030 RepID=X5M4X4_9ADEN|nr:protein ORF61 [Pigeon adenovirus 1]CDO33918.1 protein ORF61 [Pigeon adenovirus 1]
MIPTWHSKPQLQELGLSAVSLLRAICRESISEREPVGLRKICSESTGDLAYDSVLAIGISVLICTKYWISVRAISVRHHWCVRLVRAEKEDSFCEHLPRRRV